MKDLSTFVRDEFLKNHLFDEGVYISTIDEADKIISEVSYGRYVNIVFEHSGLKDYFINNLHTQRPDINVINCNCTVNKFYENDFDGLLIFNNVKKCKHNEIVEEIKKHKGILIC